MGAVGPKGVKGGSKRGRGPPPPKKSFKFLCLEWPMLTEMTAHYGKYLYFFAKKGGYPPSL